MKKKNVIVYNEEVIVCDNHEVYGNILDDRDKVIFLEMAVLQDWLNSRLPNTFALSDIAMLGEVQIYAKILAESYPTYQVAIIWNCSVEQSALYKDDWGEAIDQIDCEFSRTFVERIPRMIELEQLVEKE